MAKRQNWQLTFSGLCYAPCLRRPACRPQCRPKRNMLLEACAAAVEGQLAEVGARAEVGPTGARLCSCCRSDFMVEVIYKRLSLGWGARLPARLLCMLDSACGWHGSLPEQKRHAPVG